MNQNGSSYFSRMGTSTIQQDNFYSQLLSPFIHSQSQPSLVQSQIIQHPSQHHQQQQQFQQFNQQPPQRNNYQQLPQTYQQQFQQSPQPLIMNDQFFSNYMSNYQMNRLAVDPLQKYQQGQIQLPSPYSQPMFVNGPIQKNSPMFVGPQNINAVKNTAFTPIRQTRADDNQILKALKEDEWRRYPEKELYLSRDKDYNENIAKPWQSEEIQNNVARMDQLRQYKKAMNPYGQRYLGIPNRQKPKKKKKVIIEESESSDESDETVTNQKGKRQQQKSQAMPGFLLKDMNNQDGLVKNKKDDQQQAKQQQQDKNQVGNMNKTSKTNKTNVSNKDSTSKKSVKPPTPPPKRMVYKNRGEKNLRLFYIRFYFVVIYFILLKKLILSKKKKFELQMNDAVNKAFESGTEWGLTFMETFLDNFWKAKDKYDWIEEEKLADKEKKTRVNRCMVFIDRLIDLILQYSKESNFDPELLIFLGHVCQNYEFPPQNYFFNFELKRLQFTQFGSLKNMNINTKKMNLGIFFLIRIIGYTILYNPWNLGLDQVNQSDKLQENCVIVTSVLHELVVSEFRVICPVKNDNQNHLPVEDQIQPRSQGPLKYEADPSDANERRTLRTSVEPLIYPLYNAKEMHLIFEKETKWVEGTKDKLDELYERFVKILDGFYKKEKQKNVKKSLVDKMLLLKSGQQDV